MDDLSVLPLRYIVVSEKARAYITPSGTSTETELEPLFKLKGDHVHKTYLDYSAAMTSAKNSDTPPAKTNLLKAISKNMALQIWDVAS